MSKAKQNIDEYTSYVDSVSDLNGTEANLNWKEIENGYSNHKSMAMLNLNNIKKNEALKIDIDKATSKFEAYKVQIEEEMQQQKIQDLRIQKDNFRMSLLGKNYINDDMKFEWINKNNILSVYQNFVDTTEANKDNYSREDWDEIKLLYEAIDTRKNTVEKEGLSSSDNRKIAGLKLKFAPMYTLNRMGAKSEENANSKKN
ncbi:hypothetical protein ADIWIN_1154 [Winogradskyella psychrotolerans RS-3]|uniref:Uncharacterized protein n=2 Tax=Winogradskyella TaxID=286104 RepID=S7X432_9FLAO|nr:hypothetical protein ADIWIN_1154 [Winogradskyella psychrotolerans RS-3]